MTRRVTVDAEELDEIAALIGGRIFHSLDLSLPLDDLDAERIREAHERLQDIIRKADPE
jgi:NAD(P)H-dependent FMN reductase